MDTKRLLTDLVKDSIADPVMMHDYIAGYAATQDGNIETKLREQKAALIEIVRLYIPKNAPNGAALTRRMRRV